MTNPSDYSLRQAADPSTPAALLGEIATHRPDLRAAIAANPTAYPELLDWLRSFGDPAIDAALAARSGAAPAVQGHASQHDWAQQAQQPQQGYGVQPSVAQDPSVTQPLPTGYGAYGVTPATPPAAAAAAPWAPPTADASAGQWNTAGPSAAWTPQGAGAAPAWGQQPVADPNAAWSQQPVADPNAFWTQPQPTSKKSRRGLWIGLGVAGALVVGGVAFAANALWFSKVGGAATPEAAVTQMIDAAVAKDFVGVYGVTSPSEFTTGSTALTLFTDRLSEGTDLDMDALTDVYKDYLDAFDLGMEGLEVEVEEIEDGLAKVTVVAGQVTIDADADKLVDATERGMAVLEVSPMADLLELSGEQMPSQAELRENMESAVAETFPVDVSVDDLDTEPFLMVVREGGSWYVSPTLTMLEYGAASEGIERGTLPSDDLAGHFDSPEAAAEGLVTGVTEYLATGDTDALMKPLPLADRRVVALYGKADEIDLDELAELQEVLENSEIDASFSVRDEKDGVAWLQLDSFTFSGEVQGMSGTFEVDGECFTADVEGQLIKGCLDDIPALKELGIGDLSLIAVEEDGSWYITYAGTAGDGSGILLSNVLRLYDEGKLTDLQWWSDNLGVLGDQLF